MYEIYKLHRLFKRDPDLFSSLDDKNSKTQMIEN
jgi:hypothetical protein